MTQSRKRATPSRYTVESDEQFVLFYLFIFCAALDGSCH